MTVTMDPQHQETAGQLRERVAFVTGGTRGIGAAIGHAMAYSAAVKANLPKPILDVYESSVIRQDPAWYSEHGMPRSAQRIRENKAVSSLIPELPKYLSALEIENYVMAPVISDSRWKAYLSLLIVYNGSASPSELVSCSATPMMTAKL